MRRIAIFAAIIAGMAALDGCGSSETQPEAQVQAQKAPPVPPEVVTREFLEAVRTGDDKKADALLTDMAREKTQQVDLVLKPTPSQTAKYEVGEVEILEGQVAHVESFWTDIGDDGMPKTIPFVWALRLDTAGWRVGGVATKLFDDAPLLLLNFEDPEDMLRKTAALEAEMMRRMNGGATPSGTAAVGPLANSTAPSGGMSSAMAAPGAATSGVGQNVGASSTSTTPGAVPPGALPPGSAMPVGAVPPGTLASPGGFAPPTALAPGALPPGSPAAGGLPPGSIVPAGGISAPGASGTVQPAGAQAMPAPGFLPPGSQAQQPLPPGNLPR
jgi:hypothetical protein